MENKIKATQSHDIFVDIWVQMFLKVCIAFMKKKWIPNLLIY